MRGLTTYSGAALLALRGMAKVRFAVQQAAGSVGRLVARTRAALHHPNGVQALDLPRLNGHFVVVRKYLYGETLGERRGRMGKAGSLGPGPIACRLVADAAGGSAYLHERGECGDREEASVGVIHPSNAIACYDGRVKITDLGRASDRHVGRDEGSSVLRFVVLLMMAFSGGRNGFVAHLENQSPMGI